MPAISAGILFYFQMTLAIPGPFYLGCDHL